METKNTKTYYDLIADTENTWEFEEDLEEELFECDAMLENTVTRSYALPIKKGDSIMANKGVSMNVKSKEDVIIDANLELIDELAKRLSNSEDKIFVDKIISTTKEIVEIQRSIIKELKESKKRLTADDIPWAEDEIDKSKSFISEKTLNSFMPLYGNGFETDKQVIKAFSNYLQYHNVKKLSKLTAYDYCSRVKNLWEPFFKDWQSGALEGIIQFSNEGVLPNSPLLNVYNNFHVIFRYVDYKIKLQEKGTPAFKNLANANAALNKFLEFRSMVQNNK